MDDILSLLVLLLVLGVVGVNFYRKVEEGRRNYDVYVQELEALEELQAENDQLREELAYYNSAEYRLLYARDSLNLVRPGETLFELAEEIVIYDFAEEPVDLYAELEPLDVWQHLLR